MSITLEELKNSYMQGIAKSMDIQNKISLFKNIAPATISSAWADVGKELSNSMKVMNTSLSEKGLGSKDSITTLSEKLAKFSELNQRGLGSKDSITTLHKNIS
ncbi:MAG: hypothetical protein Q8R58_07825 [Sulfuricurvum sp.]|nr:hypothetical protein [Sulfuricurvum sp.]